MKPHATSQEFFESKYRDNPDPWAFASSEYEKERYQVTFEALGRQRYKRAFEPGCSIGILTARLATICDQVEASDISSTAVELARGRCRGLSNVSVSQGELPGVIPAGNFDLIVLSEIGYYFAEEQLQRLGERLVRRLLKGGTLLAVHWLGHSEDHVLHGDRVHEILRALAGMTPVQSERYAGFRLDRWRRA